MSHRAGDVVLDVEASCGTADEECWDNFFDEDDAAARFASAHPPHIETEVHLLKLLVKQQRNSHYPRLGKQKSHQAHVSFPVIGVDHCPLRREPIEQFPINGKVKHRQIAPLGRKEWFGLSG